VKRNRVLTRDELLAELATRARERSIATERPRSFDELVGGILNDLAELGADPVGQAKKLIEEETA
jgi:hypothetical protein